MSVVNFKHFARNKYSELIRLESCFLGIIFFTSKFPGNSVPNEYLKLLLQKNVMILVRNKPCKSSTKSNLSFLKYLINEKSIFIKLRKAPFLNRFFKSAFGILVLLMSCFKSGRTRDRPGAEKYGFCKENQRQLAEKN